MIPTDILRARLRKLLSEVIPSGGTESDTKFLNSELDDLLTDTNSINGAAATGWTMKAGMLQSQIESFSAGQEKYTMTSLKDQYAHAHTMANQYASMAKTSIGSLIIGIAPPEVL